MRKISFGAAAVAVVDEHARTVFTMAWSRWRWNRPDLPRPTRLRKVLPTASTKADKLQLKLPELKATDDNENEGDTAGLATQLSGGRT